MFGIFHDYSRNYRSPILGVPNSLFEKLPNEMKSGFKVSNGIIPIDDELFMTTNGNPITAINPPSMPETFNSILSQVMVMFDRMSGHSLSLRGEAMSGWSGSLYRQMTINARGVILETSKHTSEHIERLVTTWIQLIADYLPPEVFAERNKKYPVQVLYGIKRKIKKMAYDLDIQVAGADSQQAEAEELANFAQTAPFLWQSQTFVKTILDKRRIPNSDKIAAEIAQVASANQQQPPQPK